MHAARMPDEEPVSHDLYTRFDFVVRNDGRSRSEIWDGLDEVFCRHHPHHEREEDCAIEVGFSMSGTLEELLAANQRFADWAAAEGLKEPRGG